MFFLSVGAIFKNETMGLKEWLDHYLFFGVEHFYLINDDSSDNFLEILQPYIEKNQVTVYNNDIPKKICGFINKGRQAQVYNKYFSNLKDKTKWLLIVDLDEYVYSPQNHKISDILLLKDNFSQVSIDWLMFGSNGLLLQPCSIRKGFTKRSNIIYSYKSIVKIKDVLSFNIHSCAVNGETFHFRLEEPNYENFLICNHYRVQSREYWEKSPMKRGDADCNESDTWRDWSIFEKYDHNDVVDERLKNIISTE